MRLLLSCIATKHSVLKQHWTTSSEQIQCPLTVLGSYEKPQEDLGGLLCLIEDMGCSQKTTELKMAAGLVDSDKGVLVTAFSNIHEVDADLGIVQQDVVSSPHTRPYQPVSSASVGVLDAPPVTDTPSEQDTVQPHISPPEPPGYPPGPPASPSIRPRKRPGRPAAILLLTLVLALIFGVGLFSGWEYAHASSIASTTTAGANVQPSSCGGHGHAFPAGQVRPGLLAGSSSI